MGGESLDIPSKGQKEGVNWPPGNAPVQARWPELQWPVGLLGSQDGFPGHVLKQDWKWFHVEMVTCQDPPFAERPGCASALPLPGHGAHFPAASLLSWQF